MNLKIGDKVIFDGIISEIETFWSQMNHMYFKLTDGRVVIDAHKFPDENNIFQVLSENDKRFKVYPSVVNNDDLPPVLKEKMKKRAETIKEE